MTTHRTLWIAVLLMVCGTTTASASGFNIFWNDCGSLGGGLGVTNKSFACNTNVGTSLLVGSFEPPTTIGNVIGGSATIDLQFATAGSIPAWWQLAAGGCRDGGLHLDLGASAQTCLDAWQGAATGSVSYLPNFGGSASRARINASWWIPEALAVQVSPGNEYFAFKLVLDHTNTVGSCSGCEVPVCVVLNSVWLYQAPGAGDYPICAPLNADFATWQGGVVGCPGESAPPPPSDCLATPAVRHSWGLMKSLYR